MTAPTSSKEAQLARIRRNQQRCRERKRTYVAELEAQVQTLRAKVQQCAPCTPSPSTITHNEQLARLQQENNARHDLLLALGLNDQVQTRYLESASKRHALESILRDDAPPTDLDLPAVVSPSMYGQAPERANAGRERPGDVRDVAEASGSMTGPMDCHDSLSHAPDFAGPTTGMDAMPDNWHLSTDATMDWSTLFSDPAGSSYGPASPPSDHLDLPDITIHPDTSHTDLSGRRAVQSEDPRLNTHEKLPANVSAPASPTAGSLTERCFLETAIHVHSGQSSTACSVAISLVLQHNRKGLSLAELHKRMKPGFMTATGRSGECRMNDTDLFRVLADVSTA